MSDLFLEILLHEVKKLDKEELEAGLDPQRLAFPDKNLLDDVYKQMGVILWQ